MPSVEAIPEHTEDYTRLKCPSLYSIIEFICSLTSCLVLIVCFSSTLWVETFIHTS